MNLKVDASIPYGNACDVSVADEGGKPVVSFAADPHGGPECLWFCFRLKRARSVKKATLRQAQGGPEHGRRAIGQVKLILKHPGNMLGVGKAENLRPVVRHPNAAWERIGPGTAEDLADGRRLVSWIITVPGAYADVAFCYPYGTPDIARLLRETREYWRADTIGLSQAGRPLVRLSNGPGEMGSQRPGLYLVARQHSGETPGSWVLDGFLRHMASLGKNAPLIWAVPLSNIDGVEQGDYGKDNFPYDLNRAWGSVPMRHETLVIQRDVQRWKSRCRPVLGIDFHAPGASEADGIYFYIPNPEKYPEHHKTALLWTDSIAGGLTPKFASKSFGRVAKYASRWETPTFAAYCCNVPGMCGASMETPYALAGDTLLTAELYQEAGRRMAESIVRKCENDMVKASQPVPG